MVRIELGEVIVKMDYDDIAQLLLDRLIDDCELSNEIDSYSMTLASVSMNPTEGENGEVSFLLNKK